VDDVGDEQRDDHLDRHREGEDRVVAQRVQKERVVEEETEVVQTDPLGRRDAVPPGERVVEDAPERVDDEDRDEGDRRRRVEETPQPARAAGPPPCERYGWSAQGLSVLRPF
jgi:hypothetical protein